MEQRKGYYHAAAGKGKEELGGRGGAGQGVRRVKRREAEKQERKERNGDKEWSIRHCRGKLGK